MIKSFKYITLVVIAALLFSANAFAQLDDYGWRIGGGVGNMYYYGDLSPKFDVGQVLKNHYKFDKGRDLSYNVFLERRLTPGMSLMFSGSQGYITANDRTDNKGKPEFDRALNFRTKIQSLNAAIQFKSDNDKLLGERFFLAPYLFAGGGITSFDVSGNLKDANGNFYNYLGGSEVVQDNSYETNLTNIGTEGNQEYATKFIPHASVGVGLRLRFLRILSLHFQTDLRYAFTDYLDDVSNPEFRSSYDNTTQAFAGKPNPQYAGPRGNSNGWDDIYANTTVSLHVSFGRKKEGFKPPVFYSKDEVPAPVETVKLIPNEVAVGNGKTVVVYDTVRVIQQGYQSTIDSSALGKAQAMIDSLESVKISARQMSVQLEESRAEYKALQATLEANKNSTASEQNALLSRLDSLQKTVNGLTIVAAHNIDTTQAKGTTATQVDSLQMDEINKLRQEIDRLKAGQDARTKANQAAAAAQAVGRQPEATVSVITTPEGKTMTINNAEDIQKANTIAEVYYKKFQSDVDLLSAQVAALTTVVNKQPAAVQQPTVMPYPPTYYPPQPYYYPVPQQQPAMPNNNMGNPAAINNADAQSIMTAIQLLNTQLTTMSTRLSNLENKSGVTPTPQQPVVINTPAPPVANNDAANAAMLATLQDLRNQLSSLNNKVTTMENKPAPAPVQPAPPTVITVEKPVIVEKQVQVPVEKPVIVNTKPAVSYESETVRLSNLSIYFDINSTVIKSSELNKLSQIAEVLRRYPQGRISINGYADNTGSSEYNRKLSEKRAYAVRDRLIQGYGISAGQLSVNFYGKEGASSAGSQYDRRVDMQWLH